MVNSLEPRHGDFGSAGRHPTVLDMNPAKTNNGARSRTSFPCALSCHPGDVSDSGLVRPQLAFLLATPLVPTFS